MQVFRSKGPWFICSFCSYDLEKSIWCIWRREEESDGRHSNGSKRGIWVKGTRVCSLCYSCNFFVTWILFPVKCWKTNIKLMYFVFKWSAETLQDTGYSEQPLLTRKLAMIPRVGPGLAVSVPPRSCQRSDRFSGPTLDVVDRKLGRGPVVSSSKSPLCFGCALSWNCCLRLTACILCPRAFPQLKEAW